MRPTAAIGQMRELARVSSAAARAYGIGRLEAARTARRLRRRNGFEYREALKEGLLDPGLSEEKRYGYIGRSMRRPAQDRLNPVSLEPFTEQKLIFYRYCVALGIPVPALYGVVGRAGGWSHITGRPVADREAFAAFVEELPDEFVAKPAFGYHGVGIRVLERADGRLVDSDGSPVDPAALYDELVADPEFDLHVVQERLRNHPVVEEITGSPVLQTLRVNTLVRPDGSVLVFGAAMKLAVGRGATDNYDDGRTGNGFSEISIDDGVLGPLMVPAPGGFGYVSSPVAPGTGQRVEGRRLPCFAEACELVQRSAPLFLPMRTLGWDVAVTSAGPVVVEANNWWGPFTSLPDEAWALLLSG